MSQRRVSETPALCLVLEQAPGALGHAGCCEVTVSWCHAFTGATRMGAVQAALRRVQATRPPDGHGAGLCIYAHGQALCTVPGTGAARQGQPRSSATLSTACSALLKIKLRNDLGLTCGGLRDSVS